MFKKILAGLLVSIMAASLMAGCGENSNTVTPGETVTLAIWHSRAEDMDETSDHQRYLRVADKFMAENEGYEVQVTGSVKAEKIMTALASGSGPDIVQPQWPYAGKWGAEGIIADLTDFVDNDAEFDRDDFVPAAWDRCIYKDRIYAIPTRINSAELYYNKDILEEEGVKVPETIEELVDLAINLTEYDANGNITRCGFIPDYPWLDNVLWPVAFGAKWIDEDTNTITFDTEEMRAAYQWQIDIYNAIGYDKLTTFKAGLGSGEQEGFVSGKVAMKYSGENLFDDILLYNPDMNYGVTSVPYPAGKEELKGATFATVASLMLNNDSKNSKEDGWKLLSYITSKEALADFAKGVNNTGALMSRKSALDTLNNMEGVVAEKKEVTKMIQDPNVTGFPMSTYVNEYLAIIADEMGKVFADPANNTVEVAAANIQAKAQVLADASPSK